MKPTVYIETTVVSYLTAWPSRDVLRLSHEIITREWWAKQRPSFDLYVSEFVTREAGAGDATAARERLDALAGIPLLPLNAAVSDLTDRLAAALSLPERARLDAAHAAVAAVHGVSFLLTWNCKHLANGVLAPKIEQTCRAAGFTAPRIITPQMLSARQTEEP